MTRRALHRGTAVLGAALALGPAAAAAQVPADTATRDTAARDTASRDSAAVLAPVQVAAPRFAGAAGSAPYAISVRTAASLPQGTPAMALDEALRGIPGIQVDNRFNYALGERISVRGAGARAQFGVRGLRVLIDGIPATLPDGQTTLNQVDPSTIARIEVVRGPVASLYGNAAGGAILLETEPPPRAPFAARTTVAGGSNGLLRTLAAAGGTQGAVGYSASMSRVAYGGFRDHSTADNRYASARASWVGRRDYLRAMLNVVDYDALNPGSLSDSLRRLDPRQAFTRNVAQQTGERGGQQQGGLQWRRALGGADDLEVTTWVIARDVDNPIPNRIVVVDRLAGGARALLRGARGGLAWSAGIEHEQQRDDRQNYVNSAGSRGVLVLDQQERVSAVGAFLQGSMVVHPRVTMLGGVRHDRTAFGADDRLVGASDPDDSGRRVLGATSPSAGVSVRLTRDVLVYANAGTAFETPTTTELANRPDGAGGFNPELEPQRTASYEIGARREGVLASVQIAAYRMFVRDALVPFEVPGFEGRQFFRNAGQTATSGLELGAALQPVQRLRLAAAYTFTDSRFRDFTVGADSYVGNQVPGVAPHRAELSATYRHGGYAVGADLRHQSRMAVDDANDAFASGFTVADIRFESEALGTGPVRLRLTGGMQNIAGTAYDASVVVNAFGRRFYEPGPGRTVHVGATLEARAR